MLAKTFPANTKQRNSSITVTNLPNSFVLVQSGNAGVLAVLWKTVSRHHSSKTACGAAFRVSPPLFRTSAGMPPAPEALLFFSSLNATCTPPRGMSAGNL